MASMLKIKVAEGKMIRDPNTAKRLESGKTYNVQKISYWLRRVKAGDVEIVKDEQPREKKVSRKPKSKSEKKRLEIMEKETPEIKEEQ